MFERRAMIIGGIELQLVPDGDDHVPPHVVFAGAPEDELARLLDGQLNADGGLPVAQDALLIRTRGSIVLVDAGLGGFSEEEGAGGRLLEHLAELGVAPDDVDVVVLTHAHTDHVGGVVWLDGDHHRPVFARARHYIGSTEWAFWMSDQPVGISAELAAAPRRCLPVLETAGLVEFLDVDREIADGVRVVSAPGHTPGHAIVEIVSRGERAVFLGDAVFHPLSVSRPEWPCLFDVDGNAAAGTRRRLLDRAARDGAVVMASHLGALGHVESTLEGFRFVQLA